MLFEKQYESTGINYTIFHIICGILLYYLCYKQMYLVHTFFVFLILLNQYFQYKNDIRIFIPKRVYKKNCNCKHFINKLTEHIVGYVIGYLAIF